MHIKHYKYGHFAYKALDNKDTLNIKHWTIRILPITLVLSGAWSHGGYKRGYDGLQGARHGRTAHAFLDMHWGSVPEHRVRALDRAAHVLERAPLGADPVLDVSVTLAGSWMSFLELMP